MFSLSFSHAPLRNESQINEFIADNEEFLTEVYNRRHETHLGQHFLNYLAKRQQKGSSNDKFVYVSSSNNAQPRPPQVPPPPPVLNPGMYYNPGYNVPQHAANVMALPNAQLYPQMVQYETPLAYQVLGHPIPQQSQHQHQTIPPPFNYAPLSSRPPQSQGGVQYPPPPPPQYQSMAAQSLPQNQIATPQHLHQQQPLQNNSTADLSNQSNKYAAFNLPTGHQFTPNTQQYQQMTGFPIYQQPQQLHGGYPAFLVQGLQQVPQDLSGKPQFYLPPVQHQIQQQQLGSSSLSQDKSQNLQPIQGPTGPTDEGNSQGLRSRSDSLETKPSSPIDSPLRENIGNINEAQQPKQFIQLPIVPQPVSQVPYIPPKPSVNDIQYQKTAFIELKFPFPPQQPTQQKQPPPPPFPPATAPTKQKGSPTPIPPVPEKKSPAKQAPTIKTSPDGNIQAVSKIMELLSKVSSLPRENQPTSTSIPPPPPQQQGINLGGMKPSEHEPPKKTEKELKEKKLAEKIAGLGLIKPKKVLANPPPPTTGANDDVV